VRSDAEAKIMRDEMKALLKTPTDMIAHGLKVSHATAEYLQALIQSAVEEWKM
jgi:hypothetical protein